MDKGKNIKPVILNKSRDVTLSPYIVTDEIRPTFLIAPGGAYRNCEESEGKPVARAFNELGYNAFILRYSVGKHYKWPYPLDDFETAMQFINDHADGYHADPDHIIAAGFSAGGHLVSAAASAAKTKPFAAVLCYGLTAEDTLQFCAPDAPDTSGLVSFDTRPCFIASSRNDWIVPVHNTTRLIEAFNEYYVDYEAHIYGYALHGFSVGASAGAQGPLFCSRVGNWVGDCLEWIDELISGRYRSVRECAQYKDRFSEVLSTANSCRVIFSDTGAAKIIKRRFPVEYLMYQATKAKVGDFMDTVSLRNLFELMKVSDKTISKMDEALSEISNFSPGSNAK